MEAASSSFIPGLDLSETLYQEAVLPILERRFPGLAYSAALLGPGSEVLGLDTPQSRDHAWGPRLMLFLSEQDYARLYGEIDQALRESLPAEIHGYPIDMACYPDYVPTGDPVHHQVTIHTLRQFFQDVAGIDVVKPVEPLDWLLASQQQLLSLTAGRVFADRLGELEHARRLLAYYPHDVWLYILAAQWMRISQEEHLMGRAGQAGDEIGSRLIAARLVRDLMNLGFLMERRYAPYAKWFGTAFSRLDCACTLQPLLEQALAAATWQERQAPLATAYEIMAGKHNALGITAPLPDRATPFYNRPFQVIWGERFSQAIRAAIQDPAVMALPENLGSVDQVIDSTDGINFVNQYRHRLKSFFMPKGI